MKNVKRLKNYAVPWEKIPEAAKPRIKKLQEKGVLEGDVDGDNKLIRLVAKEPLSPEAWQPILDFVLRGIPWNAA